MSPNNTVKVLSGFRKLNPGLNPIHTSERAEEGERSRERDKNKKSFKITTTSTSHERKKDQVQQCFFLVCVSQV